MPRSTKSKPSKSRSYISSKDQARHHPPPGNTSITPVTDQSNSGQSINHQPRHRSLASYPTDPDALRALYEYQYTDYIAAYSKVVAQKRKIEAALNGNIEAEADIMELDDIEKLAAEHKSRKAELEHITDLYMNGPTPGAVGSRF